MIQLGNMLLSLSHILVVLEHYKYILIFPIMIIEGPIITVISGFLVYLGFLNIFITYPLLVVGDLIGDSVYYTIGRYSDKFMWMRKVKNFLGYTDKNAEYMRNHFENHSVKTLLLAKISHGLGIPVQISAGISRLNFAKYISIELIATMIKTLFLLVIGFYLGTSYVKINTYLHNIALVSIGILVLIFLFVLYNRCVKSYLKTEK